VGRFHFAVGMRLHFLIFAALSGTPFAALPYASKVTGLLEDLGLDIPPLGGISIGQLIARIDHSWDTRDKVRAHIAERVPVLTARAGQTSEWLLPILRHSASNGYGSTSKSPKRIRINRAMTPQD
jgi:polysaccharide pyruvyl transferase WcaK-like protein